MEVAACTGTVGGEIGLAADGAMGSAKAGGTGSAGARGLFSTGPGAPLRQLVPLADASLTAPRAGLDAGKVESVLLGIVAEKTGYPAEMLNLDMGLDSDLGIDSIKRVVDKLVVELEAKLGNNNVTLELDDEAREWIAARGYDPKMGARPMARVIQEQIKRPLAEELLFGSLADGGHVKITVGEDEQLQLNAEPVLKELEHLPGG